MKKISVFGATLLGAAVLCAAPISLHLSQDKGMSLSADEAQARIGRPLSPGSIAGVHRRYERRAYRRGSYGQGYSGSGGYYGASQGYIPAGTPCKEAAKTHSRRIGRPATPSSVSASKPGRPRTRAPSIISRSRLQRKGEGADLAPSPVLRAAGGGTSSPE